MLINLTPNIEEIERRKIVAKENNFEYTPQFKNTLLRGVYRDIFDFNFPKGEFLETLTPYEYGIADSVEQITDYYKDITKDLQKFYIVSITPVFQNKENRGKGGGWRWHKWGKYIGNLNPQYEYLDDEEFTVKYILVYTIYSVII